MSLTDIQKKHAISINWLVNGPRGEGKTFLLLTALLERANRYRGEWIDLCDVDRHSKDPRDNSHLINTLHQAFSVKFKDVEKSVELQIMQREMKFRILTTDISEFMRYENNEL